MAAAVRLDVEALLVWTYRHQRADVVIDRGLGLHRGERLADGQVVYGSSSCGCAAVERIQLLGVRVDGTGGCDALHEDAEVVHQVVGRLAVPLRALVVQHARRRDRPDVLPDAVPRLLPLRKPGGAVVMRYPEWDRHRRYGYCPVRASVSVVMIEAARLEYGLWWGALERVASTLRVERRLVRHVVTGVMPPARPWIKESIDTARIG